MCDQLHHAGRKLKWLLLVRSRPLRYSPPLPLSYAACWSTSGPALIFTNVSIHVTSRTDTQCLCTNQGLQQAAISCLQQSCTAQDLQNAESLVNTECACECLSIFAVVPVPIKPARRCAAPEASSLLWPLVPFLAIRFDPLGSSSGAVPSFVRAARHSICQARAYG